MKNKDEEQVITMADIENERVSFERGIWVFWAENLYSLRDKLRKFLISTPNAKKSLQVESELGSKQVHGVRGGGFPFNKR